MKATFIALLAVLLCVGGCGKKKVKQTAKETPKTKEAPENAKPKPPSVKPGTVLWEFETGFTVASSPAIGPDGTVYVGSDDNKLYAINGKSGVKLWEFETGGPVSSSPAIGSDGTVYVGSGLPDNNLYAIKTDSKGLAKSPWPMRGQNARHTGRVMKKYLTPMPSSTIYAVLLALVLGVDCGKGEQTLRQRATAH
jgi:hypothetical protein